MSWCVEVAFSKARFLLVSQMAKGNFLPHRCCHTSSNVSMGCTLVLPLRESACMQPIWVISSYGLQVGAHGRQLQYDGNWVRGRREGPGLCYYFNGETYQGDCLPCNLHISNIAHNYSPECPAADPLVQNAYVNTACLAPNWIQGEKLILERNAGQWLNNQRHGHGRMQYSNGDVYEGPWVKDHRTGLAKYFYANGDIFVGRYEHNRREGLGTIYMVNTLCVQRHACVILSHTG